MTDFYYIYPNFEIGFNSGKDINDELAFWYNNETFLKSSAILTIKIINTKVIKVKHVPTKEKVLKKTNKLRFGYTNHIQPNLTMRKILKLVIILVDVYEVSFSKEKFKVSPFNFFSERLLKYLMNTQKERKTFTSFPTHRVVGIFGVEFFER